MQLGLRAGGSLPPNASSGIAEPSLRAKCWPKIIWHRPFIDPEKLKVVMPWLMVFCQISSWINWACLIPKRSKKHFQALTQDMLLFHVSLERSRQGFFTKNCCQNQLVTSSTYIHHPHVLHTLHHLSSPILSTPSSLNEPWLDCIICMIYTISIDLIYKP